MIPWWIDSNQGNKAETNHCFASGPPTSFGVPHPWPLTCVEICWVMPSLWRKSQTPNETHETGPTAQIFEWCETSSRTMIPDPSDLDILMPEDTCPVWANKRTGDSNGFMSQCKISNLAPGKPVCACKYWECSPLCRLLRSSILGSETPK